MSHLPRVKFRSRSGRLNSRTANRETRRDRASRLHVEALEDRKTPSALVVGAAPGNAPVVQILDESGTVVREFEAFHSSFRGGVNVAQGDVNGDGVSDIIAATADHAGLVKVFDGATYDVINRFQPYGAGYRGGVNVAFGQVLDGTGDIITGTARGRAVVRVFDGSTAEPLQRILPYGAGVRGVNVAAGNLAGGFLSSVITAPARGGQPLVKSFDAETGALVSQFLAYDATYRGGVQIASGDFDSNVVPDLVTAPAGTGTPLIRVWSSGPGHPLVSEFVAASGLSPASASAASPSRGVELGVFATAGREGDRIAITPRIAAGARDVELYDLEGMPLGGIAVAGLGRRDLSLSSSAADSRRRLQRSQAIWRRLQPDLAKLELQGGPAA